MRRKDVSYPDLFGWETERVLERYREILDYLVDFTDLEYRKNPDPWKIRSLIKTRLSMASAQVYIEGRYGETYRPGRRRSS